MSGMHNPPHPGPTLRDEPFCKLLQKRCCTINFAAGQYEDSKGESVIPNNPVKRLSQTRAWYRIERRQTVIKAHALALWYAAVMNIKNQPHAKNAETIRDYLLLVLFTGLRK
ncbi:MAG: hypothetical protein NUV75_06170 [Gallionella sp.]|nr:hypothetical protein [Gallionella sp.]